MTTQLDDEYRERPSVLDEGTRLNVHEAGSGRPIVFVHGWPTSGRVWTHQIAGLAARYRVLAIDLPGFGASPPVSESTVARFADILHRFLVAEDLRGVVLVGWSLGGGIVMCYCRDFADDRLAAIGIVDDCPRLLPGPGWDEGVHTPLNAEFIEGRRRRWPHERQAIIEELTNREFRDPVKDRASVDWLIAESLRSDPDAAIAVSTDIYRYDFRPDLSTIQVPALLLFGIASTLTLPATRSFMANAIPRAELVVFEESGHNPMLEEPEHFNEVVDRFASRLGPW